MRKVRASSIPRATDVPDANEVEHRVAVSLDEHAVRERIRSKTERGDDERHLLPPQLGIGAWKTTKTLEHVNKEVEQRFWAWEKRSFCDGEREMHQTQSSTLCFKTAK